jgi:hypothetical protein
VGRAEREILNHLREADESNEAWDSSKVARLLFRSEATCTSKRRQTYRVLERARVVPDALSVDELISRVSSGVAASEVRKTVAHARRYRKQISIVQVKEIRLGQWAVTWNNLRLARNWLWLTDDSGLGEKLPVVADQFLASHRLPCCLLFDNSAERLREFLIGETGLNIDAFGSSSVGYSVSES